MRLLRVFLLSVLCLAWLNHMLKVSLTVWLVILLLRIFFSFIFLVYMNSLLACTRKRRDCEDWKERVQSCSAELCLVEPRYSKLAVAGGGGWSCQVEKPGIREMSFPFLPYPALNDKFFCRRVKVQLYPVFFCC